MGADRLTGTVEVYGGHPNRVVTHRTARRDGEALLTSEGVPSEPHPTQH